MQITIKDIQTQEIVAQGSVDQVKALYEEEDVLDAIDQAIEDQAPVVVYGFVGNGIEITATESSNQMQNQKSLLDEIKHDQEMYQVESAIEKAMDDYQSPYYYALHYERGELVIYPESAHPLTGSENKVFIISAISETHCRVRFIDEDGYYVEETECKIDGLAASIESEMIAIGYKA